MSNLTENCRHSCASPHVLLSYFLHKLWRVKNTGLKVIHWFPVKPRTELSFRLVLVMVWSGGGEEGGPRYRYGAGGNLKLSIFFNRNENHSQATLSTWIPMPQPDAHLQKILTTRRVDADRKGCDWSAQNVISSSCLIWS